MDPYNVKLTQLVKEFHLEVIYAAAAARGCGREELERIRAAKAEKRGGFEQKILLIDVDEG